ncbi:MAG3960 family lipoprotein [Mycoplasma sp. Z407A]|uniref:MAG3960 family lipoprotein n=1 Tax=Mycoplasma sp. Z407A TaxID=3401678 RepID=UPI003AAAA010
MKRKWLLAFSLCGALIAPLSAVSCDKEFVWKIGFDTYKPKGDGKKDKNKENPPLEKGGDKIEAPVLSDIFAYKDKTYYLNNSDTWKTYQDREKWRYDYEAVAEENSWMEQKIKQDLNLGTYIAEVNTAGDGVISQNIPSIAFISKYVRNLDFTKNGKLVKKQDGSYATSEQYKMLLGKLKEILNPSTKTDFDSRKYGARYAVEIVKPTEQYLVESWNILVNSIKDLDIFSYYSTTNQYANKILIASVELAQNWWNENGYTSPYGGWYNYPSKNKSSTTLEVLINGYPLLTNSTNIFDDVSVAFTSLNMGVNEANHPNYTYGNDMNLYLNLISSSYIKMQMLQYQLLNDYLDFLIMMSNKQEDETIKQHLAKEENKKILNKYHNRLIEYLQAKMIVGTTIPREDGTFKNYDLTLFAGGQYARASDYQDTYLWAKEQFENVTLPLMYDEKDETKSSLAFKISFNEQFKNSNKEDKYQLIWTALEKSTGASKPSVPNDTALASKQKDIYQYATELFGYETKQ